MTEVVNEQSGEVRTVDDYIAAQRCVEREIQRLTHTEAKLKGELKKVREGREQAVEELRAMVRETGVVARAQARRRRRKGNA